jgi:hypothetical protein
MYLQMTLVILDFVIPLFAYVRFNFIATRSGNVLPTAVVEAVAHVYCAVQTSLTGVTISTSSYLSTLAIPMHSSRRFVSDFSFRTFSLKSGDFQ